MDKRKQLIRDYKNKPSVGAVYAIECGGNQRRVIKATADIGGIAHRFQFAMATKTCPDPTMRREWAEYGAAAFSLVVLEELTMKEDQTAREFMEEMNLLREMWVEKLASGQPQ